MSVEAITDSSAVARIHLSVVGVAPGAGPSTFDGDLTYAPETGSFWGVVALDPGNYQFAGTAFDAADVQVSDPALQNAVVSLGATTSIFLRILDSSGPAPVPGHAPVIYGLVGSPTPVMGVATAFSVSAWDPDGEPLTYAWTTTCLYGTFDAPEAAATNFTDPSTELDVPCTVTVTVMDPGGLYDTRTMTLKVVPPAGQGAAAVSGQYVQNPNVWRVTLTPSNAGETPCIILRDGLDASCHGTFHTGGTMTVKVDYSVGAFWDGSAPSLAASCGGTVATGAFSATTATFTWTEPALGAPVGCIVQPSISNYTRSDAFPVALVLLP